MDIKYQIKMKIAFNVRSLKQTGADPNITKPLTLLEETFDTIFGLNKIVVGILVPKIGVNPSTKANSSTPLKRSAFAEDLSTMPPISRTKRSAELSGTS